MESLRNFELHMSYIVNPNLEMCKFEEELLKVKTGVNHMIKINFARLRKLLDEAESNFLDESNMICSHLHEEFELSKAFVEPFMQKRRAELEKIMETKKGLTRNDAEWVSPNLVNISQLKRMQNSIFLPWKNNNLRKTHERIDSNFIPTVKKLENLLTTCKRSKREIKLKSKVYDEKLLDQVSEFLNIQTSIYSS